MCVLLEMACILKGEPLLIGSLKRKETLSFEYSSTANTDSIRDDCTQRCLLHSHIVIVLVSGVISNVSDKPSYLTIFKSPACTFLLLVLHVLISRFPLDNNLMVHRMGSAFW